MFPFRAEIKTPAPIAVRGDSACVLIQLTNIGPLTIELGDGSAGSTNLGFRLSVRGEEGHCFEDRVKFRSNTLISGKSALGEINIPSQLVNPSLHYVLFIDMVKEGEYWFSERGGSALTEAVAFVRIADTRLHDLTHDDSYGSSIQESAERKNLEPAISVLDGSSGWLPEDVVRTAARQTDLAGNDDLKIGTSDRAREIAHRKFVPRVRVGELIAHIILLKLDHIGDFFLSIPVFSKFRMAFPSAKITLVCAPWNRPVAEELRVFDTIIEFNFFAEQSRNQSEADQALGSADSLYKNFRDKVAGRYDLAVDLRYDTETRRLLTVIDAAYRAGIGDLGEFPFLDVSLPSDRQIAASRALATDKELFFSPERFTISRGALHEPGRLRLGSKTVTLTLNFDINEPMSPLALKAGNDDRRLGVAISAIVLLDKGKPKPDLTLKSSSSKESGRRYRIGDVLAFTEHSLDVGTLTRGWATPEAFGTWSDGPKATITLEFESQPKLDVDVHLSLTAHVNPSHKSQKFGIRASEVSSANFEFTVDKPQRHCIIPVFKSDFVSLSSFAVAPGIYLPYGEYDVSFSILPHGEPSQEPGSSIRFQATNALGVVLAERVVSGAELVTLLSKHPSLSFFNHDPNLAISFRIDIDGLPFSEPVSLLGARMIAAPRSIAPTMHMSDWLNSLSDLVIHKFTIREELIQLPRTELPSELADQLKLDRASHRAIVFMAPGANKDVTKWPAEYYAELAVRLIDNVHCSIYVVGSLADGDDAKIIRQRCGQNQGLVHNFCGATSIPQIATAVRNADLFLGNSSGLTHIAAMSGVQTLAIYSATNHPNQWAPIGPRTRTLSLEMPCGPCHIINSADCRHGLACLLDLRADDVAREAVAILRRRSAISGPHRLEER